MREQPVPFRYTHIAPGGAEMPEGYVISQTDQCGLFLCRRGEAEILLGGRLYRICKGHLFFYTATNRLQVCRRSNDLQGIMLDVDLEYVIPIVNRVVNSENLLYLRDHPCLLLSDEQYAFVERLLRTVEMRIGQESSAAGPQPKQQVGHELIKAWGQVLSYELLNIYFSNEPHTPLPQNKKDKIFQNFMIELHRYYHEERDVAFYAARQCLSPRYFSSVVKEQSGSSALQWIVQKVITEAKQQLENSDLSIKEIAGRLNFPTQSFFGKYFKQYVGISPKEYRRLRSTVAGNS